MGKDKKTCSKCSESKELTEFHKDKSKPDGHNPKCKACVKKTQKKYYSDPANRKKNNEKSKEYRENNKEKIAEWKAANYQRNKDKIDAQVRAAKKRNAEHYREYNRLYQEKRVAENPILRVMAAMSAGVRRSLLRSNLIKDHRAFDYLPYTSAELQEHLESQFQPGMTWENFGTWHIDHIIPQAALQYDTTDHPNFKKCWSLENLQPLWASDNISKGSLYEGKRYTYNTN